jgi:hypothetical protein
VRLRRFATVPIIAFLLAAGLLCGAAVVSTGCVKTPPALTPDAEVAYKATRVVKVLDTVRDAAIAANELSPPAISTNDTRTIVLWHKTAVQVISAAPGDWKGTVKTSIYLLTCTADAYIAAPGIPPPATCQPQIPAAAVARLAPYVSLALVIIAEVL